MVAAVINFITYNMAVCVFTRATLLSRASYLCREHYEDPSRACGWFSKYSERGFRMIAGNTMRNYSDLQMGKRKLNDRHSWVMSFDGELSPRGHTLTVHVSTQISKLDQPCMYQAPSKLLSK